MIHGSVAVSETGSGTTVDGFDIIDGDDLGLAVFVSSDGVTLTGNRVAAEYGVVVVGSGAVISENEFSSFATAMLDQTDGTAIAPLIRGNNFAAPSSRDGGSLFIIYRGERDDVCTTLVENGFSPDAVYDPAPVARTIRPALGASPDAQAPADCGH